MPQLDTFTYITQVYTIVLFFLFFILFLGQFWQIILFQVELISLYLLYKKRVELTVLLQSLFLKYIVNHPAGYFRNLFFAFLNR